ncbi:uncharacterized protein LOC123502063 [Portunus trituberculatus]|uniref:uncharacterized protein LOC123502063 n=1 Tax=Portunus trituberculatus TaxID=210409 RepID=UPI001E1D0412|nr:uncharacterized protein LOC123502063 [Portunus trituberculatus]
MQTPLKHHHHLLLHLLLLVLFRHGLAQQYEEEGMCSCLMGVYLQTGIADTVEVPHWSPINCSDSAMCVEECQAEWVMTMGDADLRGLYRYQITYGQLMCNVLYIYHNVGTILSAKVLQYVDLCGTIYINPNHTHTSTCVVRGEHTRRALPSPPTLSSPPIPPLSPPPPPPPPPRLLRLLL